MVIGFKIWKNTIVLPMEWILIRVKMRSLTDYTL